MEHNEVLRKQIYMEIVRQSRLYLSVDKRCAFCDHYTNGVCKGQLEYDRRDCPKWHTNRKRRINESGTKKKTDGE